MNFTKEDLDNLRQLVDNKIYQINHGLESDPNKTVFIYLNLLNKLDRMEKRNEYQPD
jgi:hypothetical protein